MILQILLLFLHHQIFQKSAVGMLFLFINCLAQILLDSNCAACFDGPNTGRFFSVNLSTRPFAKGASGPTMVKQFYS